MSVLHFYRRIIRLPSERVAIGRNTYLIGGHKSLEDTVEFGRTHVALIFSIVLHDLVECRICMIDVVYEVLDLAARLAHESPHLLAVAVGLLRVGEVVGKFLLDLLQAVT